MRAAETYRGARRNEYRADAQRVKRGWRMHSDMRLPPIERPVQPRGKPYPYGSKRQGFNHQTVGDIFAKAAA